MTLKCYLFVLFCQHQNRMVARLRATHNEVLVLWRASRPVLLK